MTASSHTKYGFTLLELSIVLVIIALITGGLMVGRSLLRNSQLQSVISDINKYQSAITQFKTQYEYLPGDMPNATRYWGYNNSICPDSNSAGTPGTCNGNGDGVVLNSETLLIWQHLALAKIIPGSYGGRVSTTPYGGNMAPRSALDGAYYTFLGIDSLGFMCSINGTTPWIILGMDGKDSLAGAMYGAGGVLQQIEAQTIDAKIDDGTANTGKVRANLYDSSLGLVSGGCTSYNISNTTSRCLLAFNMKF